MASTADFPIPQRGKIDDYNLGELVALVRWIKSDHQPRTDDEIIAEMVEELDVVSRRGVRIEQAIRWALRLGCSHEQPARPSPGGQHFTGAGEDSPTS